MRPIALVFFYGYVLTLLAAGAWGVVGARLDQRLLLRLDLGQLSPGTSANVLSQYRFLRAVEFGFGLFAWHFRDAIFTQSPYSTLFLTTMALGIVARVISLAMDGRPRALLLFFLAYEAAGIVAIYATVRARAAS